MCDPSVAPNCDACEYPPSARPNRLMTHVQQTVDNLVLKATVVRLTSSYDSLLT